MKRHKPMIRSMEWHAEEEEGAFVSLYPAEGQAIQIGASLMVRQTQSAVVVDDEHVVDVFGPGRYRLDAETMPILADRNGWLNKRVSSFQASIYYLNMKPFTDLRWMTSSPVTVTDARFGTVKLKASGKFS